MKRNTFPLLVILILAVMAVTTSTSVAIVPEHGPSASGAGQFRFRNPQTARSEVFSFSFEAISNKNGQTRGRAQFDNLTTQTQVVVRINCLSVSSLFGSDHAVISGIVLHSSDPDLPKLETVLFAATDGPAFPNSSADTMTPLFPFPPFEGVRDCRDVQPLTIIPIDEGDVVIQP
jgi:hypothetical protein